MDLLEVPRPLQRLDDHAIDAEHLLLGVAGMEVVEPHRARRRQRVACANGQEDEGRNDCVCPVHVSNSS